MTFHKTIAVLLLAIIVVFAFAPLAISQETADQEIVEEEPASETVATAEPLETGTVRIKDIAYIHGVRENQLLGLGLVTGLQGKGDSPNSPLLRTVLANLFSSFEISISERDIRSKNCAVVMVTSEIPAFVRPGDRVNVHVSSVGDAKSLAGGVLLQSTMVGANGNVYAVAQGLVSEGQNSSSNETVGLIPSGAIVEREVLSEVTTPEGVSVVLREPDFQTAAAIARALESGIEGIIARARDASLVQVTIPENMREDVVQFIARLEHIRINPDTEARIAVNSRSGIVVIGKQVTIGEVAVSYKGTSISVTTSPRASSRGNSEKHLIIPDMTSARELVEILQDVGMETETVIEILKAIDAAGALHGKLIIM